MRNILLILLFLYTSASKAQTSPVVIQLGETSKLRKEKTTKQKVDVIVSITRDSGTLPDSYIIKSKLLGSNSCLLLDFPDSLLADVKSFRVVEAVYVASTSPIIPVPEVFGEFNYKPIEFLFKTVPDSATLFLIPLIDWEKIYKTTEYASVQVNSKQLVKLANYEVTKQRTPLTYHVFEQPYIGIFARGETIKKTLIQPKRKVPADNIVTINLN